MPAVRPVVSVWNVECSSCPAQRDLTGIKTERNCALGVLAIAREQRASTEARTLENGGKNNHEMGSICTSRIHTALYACCNGTRSSE